VLTETRTVLTRNTSGPELVSYTQFTVADDDGRIVLTVLMETGDWVEMGSPEMVTVTVEPGDTLGE
jgi:hypothetical protein